MIALTPTRKTHAFTASDFTDADRNRFFAKVRKTDQCWEWEARRNNQGYGTFRKSDVQMLAHRVSWLIAIGDIPLGVGYHGMCVLHRCDNPRCVRPDHLFLGTNADNASDREAKGRGNHATGDATAFRKHPESCPRGNAHYARQRPELMARGEGHGMVKLTESDVREIRRLFAAGGVFQRELAALFRVSQTQIGNIIRRKLWKHIA